MNYGDEICLPIIEIGKYGVGTVEIINNSDGARTLSISNLQDQELVTVDCQYEDIESDQGILITMITMVFIFSWFMVKIDYISRVIVKSVSNINSNILVKEVSYVQSFRFIPIRTET